MKFSNIVYAGIIVCMAAGAQSASGKVVLKAPAEGAIVPQLWPEQKELFETPLELIENARKVWASDEKDIVIYGSTPADIAAALPGSSTRTSRHITRRIPLGCSGSAANTSREGRRVGRAERIPTTAAAFAIDDGCAVQDVDYAKLRARLVRDGQRLK